MIDVVLPIVAALGPGFPSAVRLPALIDPVAVEDGESADVPSGDTDDVIGPDGGSGEAEDVIGPDGGSGEAEDVIGPDDVSGDAEETIEVDDVSEDVDDESVLPVTAGGLTPSGLVGDNELMPADVDTGGGVEGMNGDGVIAGAEIPLPLMPYTGVQGAVAF